MRMEFIEKYPVTPILNPARFFLSVPPHASAYGPSYSWFPIASRGKPRRGMLRRAVFSDHQRKSLEKKFQQQKYISKPDRKKLASKLGLKDSQVSDHMVVANRVEPVS